jgi:tRNA pseudouridine38-40 synthase
VRVWAILEYDGAAYCGWQVQPNASSIQQEVENALQVATGAPTRVEAAGRTDAGVHAEGQVVAFDVADGTDLRRLTAQLNGIMPRDIAVHSLSRAEAGFDPRREARSRTYRYTLVCGRPRAPLLDGRCWYLAGAGLELAELNDLAARVVGTHDFRAFRAGDCEASTTTRTVTQSVWRAQPPALVYEISANAFLKNMVRVLVGTMVDTLQGRLSGADFSRLLAGADRTDAGRTAPPQGLVLVRVAY